MACEERLLKAKIIDAPFTVAEIQGGILKQHLTDEDYTAPLLVSLIKFSQVINYSLNKQVIKMLFTIILCYVLRVTKF